MRAPKTEIWQMLPPPKMTAEELREGKKKLKRLPLLWWTRKPDLAPEGWCAYERNEFSDLRGLHLLIHRMLNSLTWYLIFDVQTACSLCCKLIYSLIPPPASLEEFSQMWSHALRVLTMSTKKNNSLLSGCNYIFLVNSGDWMTRLVSNGSLSRRT